MVAESAPAPVLPAWHSKLRAEVGRVSLFVLCLVLAIDMGGQIGLRNPVLPFCLLGLLAAYGVRLPVGAVPLAVMLVGYPTVSLLIGVWGGAEVPIAVSQYQGMVLGFVLLLLLDRAPPRTVASALFTGLALTGALAMYWLYALLNGSNYAYLLAERLREDSAGYFGARDIGDAALIMVYFKSALFFAPAAIYWLGQRRVVFYVFCVGGLLASVSRSGLLAAGVVSVAYLFTTRLSTAARIAVVATGGVVLLILTQFGITDFLLEVVHGEGSSFDVRARHYESVMELLAAHPIQALFGAGTGSAFYSRGAEAFVTNIEIDHLNTIRKFGLIWSATFFGFVGWTAFRAVRNGDSYVRQIGVCLLVGFVVAGTNPVLLTPVFLLLLLTTMRVVREAEAARPALGRTTR